MLRLGQFSEWKFGVVEARSRSAVLPPTFAFRVWQRGPRYQLLCLSHRRYRDELLPGCHHGVPPSPWKLRKHGISEEVNALKPIITIIIVIVKSRCLEEAARRWEIPSFEEPICRGKLACLFACLLFFSRNFFLFVCLFVLQPQVTHDNWTCYCSHRYQLSTWLLLAPRKRRRPGKFRRLVLNHPHR